MAKWINKKWIEYSTDDLLKMYNLARTDAVERKKKIEIKDAYLKLMIDIGFDYDGYDNVESLKSLIDELVGYARSALKCETNEMIEKIIEEE